MRAVLLSLVLCGAAACMSAPPPEPAPKPVERIVVYCDGNPTMWSEALAGETFVLFVPDRCGNPKVEVE